MASNTYSTDPALYIFTSLTAGSSHIVTATSRLETILRANRVPFKAVDIAVDQKARMLWGRRAGKDAEGRVRKLPGLVQEGLVLGDLVEIEDWNEYGELKQHVKIYYDEFTIPNIHNKPKDPPKPIRKAAAQPAAATKSATGPAAPPAPPLPKAESSSTAKKDEPKKEPSIVEKVTLPIRSIADEAAQKAKELRLQALREKVHGSKAGKEAGAGAEAEAKKESGASKEAEKDPVKTDSASEAEPPAPAKEASTTSLASQTSNTPAGTVKLGGGATTVQSPTTGTWAPATSSTDALPPRETVQSPTTARWKSTESLEPPVTVHRGSVVAAASQEEIKAVEKAEAIPEEDEESSEEESSSEEEDEEEDTKKPVAKAAASQEEIKAVEKAQAIPEAEEESSEEESSEEEDEEKDTRKPDAKTAAV